MIKKIIFMLVLMFLFAPLYSPLYASKPIPEYRKEAILNSIRPLIYSLISQIDSELYYKGVSITPLEDLKYNKKSQKNSIPFTCVIRILSEYYQRQGFQVTIKKDPSNERILILTVLGNIVV
jgi:hypothetical protein